MKTTILKLEHLQNSIISVYGGTKILIEYHLTTICENIKNEYKIMAEVRGIDSSNIFLNLYKCEALTNNENTLTTEAIEELLNW